MRWPWRTPPAYCTYCGLPLERKEYYHDFDPATGRARRITRWLQCPRSRDYGGDGHYCGSVRRERVDEGVTG